MDASRFDTFVRTLTDQSSRRHLLRGCAGAALGLTGAGLAEVVSAKKKRKPKLNAFGCLDIGQPCGGNGDRCCSGICEGKRPKQGKKDTSRCAAHNVGGCTPAKSYCAVGLPASKCGPAGADARCLATTGNAGFCAQFETFSADNCVACTQDADCERLGFGTGSACVIVDGGLAPCGETRSCKTNGSVSGTACVPPGA